MEARQAVAASNHSAITAGLISQTRFPPYHPGAASHPPGVEGDSGDNLLVLALSSTAFLFMASLPLLMWRKVRRVGELGQPHSANLVERSLPVAPSVGS